MSRQSLIERAVAVMATESGWARRKRSAICSGKLCWGFIIFEQCCPCGGNGTLRFGPPVSAYNKALYKFISLLHFTLLSHSIMTERGGKPTRILLRFITHYILTTAKRQDNYTVTYISQFWIEMTTVGGRKQWVLRNSIGPVTRTAGILT